jgi:PAS domain S-box-containing protein
MPDRGRGLYGVGQDEKFHFQRFASTLHPDNRAMVREKVEDAIAGPHPYAAEYRVKLPDGTQRWIAASGRVEGNGNGRATLLRVVSLDVTERKSAEEAARIGEFST